MADKIWYTSSDKFNVCKNDILIFRLPSYFVKLNQGIFNFDY